MGSFIHAVDGTVLIPEVWLCKRNKDKVGLLRCTQPTVHLNMNDFNTVEFDMYRFIDGELNPYYDEVVTKMLVYLGEEYGYYSIQVDQINDEGYEHKHVSGNSWESELSSRYLIDFQVNTFEEGDPVDRDGNFIVTTFWNTDDSKCLLKRVFKDTGWDVRMANTTSETYAALCATERTYDISRQDKLSFLKDLQEELDVLFVFSKTERIATCYLFDEYGDSTGIYASFNNLNKSIQITCDESKIVTQMTVMGGENIYADDVIPSATNAITNIDYFLNTQYMSQKAIDAYNYWKQQYNTIKAQYDNVLLAVNESFEKIMTYQNSAPQSKVSESDGTITELNEMTKDELLDAFEWQTYPDTTPEEERYNYGQVYLQSIYDAYSAVKELRVDEEARRDEDYAGTSLTAGLKYYSASKTYSKGSEANEPGDMVLYPNASQVYVNNPDKIPAAYEYINNTASSGHVPTETAYWTQAVPKIYDSTKKSYVLGKFDQINIILNCAQYNLNILSKLIQDEQAVYNLEYAKLMKLKAQADMKVQIKNWVYLNQTAYLTTHDGEYIISGESTTGSTIYYIGSDVESAINATVDAIYDEIQAFIWEDEYSNDNYIPEDPNDYKECIEVAKELLAQAEKTLNKNCYPRVTWECDLYNPALRDEFLFAKDKLDVGNFMYLEMHEGYTEKIRIIGIEIPFDDLPNIKFEFADRVESDNVFESIGEVIGSSTSVSASIEEYVSGMEKLKKDSEEFGSIIKEGLNAALINVFNDDAQEIKIDKYGLWGRQKIDGGDYDDRQIRIQNNQIVFTDDNWKTARAALGEITLYDMEGNPYTKYGLIADTVAVDDLYALQATIGGWKINPDSLTSKNYEAGEGGIRLGSEGTIETPFFNLDENGRVIISSNSNEGARITLSGGFLSFYDWQYGTLAGYITTVAYNSAEGGGIAFAADNDSMLHFDYENKSGKLESSFDVNHDGAGLVRFLKPVEFLPSSPVKFWTDVELSTFTGTFKTRDNAGYETSFLYGNFHHLRNNTGDSFSIQSYEGDVKLAVWYESGSVRTYGDLTVDGNISIGGSVSGQLKFGYSGWRTNSDSGYAVGYYGNFQHLGTGTTNYWAITSNDGTPAFSVNYETGTATVRSQLTVGSLTTTGAISTTGSLSGGSISGSSLTTTGSITSGGSLTVNGVSASLSSSTALYVNGLAGFSKYIYLKDGNHGDTVVGTLSASATASGSTYTPTSLTLTMSGSAKLKINGDPWLYGTSRGERFNVYTNGGTVNGYYVYSNSLSDADSSGTGSLAAALRQDGLRIYDNTADSKLRVLVNLGSGLRVYDTDGSSTLIQLTPTGNITATGNISSGGTNVLTVQSGETISARTVMGVFPAMILSNSKMIRMSVMLPREIPTSRTITVSGFSGLYFRRADGNPIYYGTTNMYNLSAMPSGVTVSAARGGENIVNISFTGADEFVTSSGGSTAVTNLASITAIVTSLTLAFS